MFESCLIESWVDVISPALVLHYTTPNVSIVTLSQIDAPVESTISNTEETVAPGTMAVKRLPPIEPEIGEMETSFGVSSKVASTNECPSGTPTSKNSF